MSKYFPMDEHDFPLPEDPFFELWNQDEENRVAEEVIELFTICTLFSFPMEIIFFLKIPNSFRSIYKSNQL